MYKKEIVPGNLGSSSPLQICTNLRMLPLLIHSLSKNIAFRGGRVPSDHRSAALNKLATAPLNRLINFIYPTVYALHTMEDDCGLPYEGEDDLYSFPPRLRGEIVLPESINASFQSLERFGLYLINNTSELFLYIGGDAVPELVRDVFGVDSLAEVQVGKSDLPELDNEFNTKIRNIINKVREGDDTISYLSLYVVIGPATNESTAAYAANRDIMPLRIWCLSDLVEDRGAGGVAYKEYLGQLRDKISN
ncbi:unnamed protein product [Ambrosiozyma monospora]|uniref:Unnamed protein product n=1 Tax=Ambrosiozyma monospora TaxID=43982 RepID=A0ACB5UB83_AMBMO|nr:unnamed protein product [Ambrosiozyma monospora]